MKKNLISLKKFFSFNKMENINDYDIPWWEDYDGDIEEEKRKIEERVSKIMDPEKYEERLNAIEYNDYSYEQSP